MKVQQKVNEYERQRKEVGNMNEGRREKARRRLFRQRCTAIVALIFILLAVIILTGLTAVPNQTKADEPIRTYIGEYRITGYTPTCSHCCGKSDGITASGAKAECGRTVAMAGVPFGTKIQIEGFEGTYVVEDRGGVGVDIACISHEACYMVTRDKAKVWIVS